jgi:hypothetical protein
MQQTLNAYQRASRVLLDGKYNYLADVAPEHMRTSCDCWAFLCTDGAVLRWD